jgi:WD40 repeat protein
VESTITRKRIARTILRAGVAVSVLVVVSLAWGWRAAHSLDQVYCVAFPPGSHTPALGGGPSPALEWFFPYAPSGILRLQDVRTGKRRDLFTRSADAATPGVSDIRFSRDGARVAALVRGTTPYGRDKPVGVQVWDTRDDKVIAAGLENDWVTALAIHPDGSWLATDTLEVTGFHTVRLWETDGQPDLGSGHTPRIYSLGTLPGSNYEGVNDLAFSPDGRYLAACGSLPPPVAQKPSKRQKTRTEVRVWRLEGKWPARSWTLPVGDGGAIAFSNDDNHLLTVGEAGVREWDWRTAKLVQSRSFAHYKPLDFNGAKMSQDGSVLVISLRDDQALTDGALVVFDARTLRQVRVLTLPKEPPGGLLDFAVSSDGQHAATVSNDSRVVLWDVATGKERVITL